MYNYDWERFNKYLMDDFNHFLKKINTRACINLGFIDEEYNNLNRHGEIDHGLGRDVEYFHPTITLDDRMRYIGTVIAQQDMSKFNILGNGIISHFYGARGVHMAVTNSLRSKNTITYFASNSILSIELIVDVPIPNTSGKIMPIDPHTKAPSRIR